MDTHHSPIIDRHGASFKRLTVREMLAVAKKHRDNIRSQRIRLFAECGITDPAQKYGTLLEIDEKPLGVGDVFAYVQTLEGRADLVTAAAKAAGHPAWETVADSIGQDDLFVLACELAGIQLAPADEQQNPPAPAPKPATGLAYGE